MAKKFDCSGWATRANVRCSDGLTIMNNAFEGDDGKTVPVVWNHEHNDPNAVLGHALLENRTDGIYAYISFNDTEAGENAKALVRHKDVDRLSIFANRLTKRGGDVVHGIIREVSLVLAGANPEARIDTVLMHGEDSYEEGYIFSGELIDDIAPLIHSDEKKDKEVEEKEEEKKGEPEMAKTNNNEEKTVQDVLNTLTEEQYKAVAVVIGTILEEAGVDLDDDEEEKKDMKHNIFDAETNYAEDEVLSHSEMTEIFAEAKRNGSLADTFLAHGITNIDYLFPDAKTLTDTPSLIKDDDTWVKDVMNSVHRSPFSRIKSIHADITGEEARARGYVKGKKKEDEVFTLLKRATTPTTVYKKQKIDRDDLVDITEMDTVAFLKSEMRLKLDEEIARAILVGDGRGASHNDKINEQNIRPIWTDDDVYTIKRTITITKTTTEAEKARAFIKEAIKSRKDYKGSGNPTMYMSEDMLTECLLLEDTTGRTLYDTVDKLATKLRVKKIVTVPPMENLSRVDKTNTKFLAGLYVNLDDYNVGADKGGAVNMFDDFDIDYNAMKYLIETRCSGALTTPYSAVVIELSIPTADVSHE